MDDHKRPRLSASSLRRPQLAGIALLAAAVLIAACADTGTPQAAAPAAQAAGLRSAASFKSIADQAERSRALFAEAGKVIEHPRCMNCHPAGDRPTQGEDRRPHQPPVARGGDGFGMTGMRCSTCHQAENFEASGVPGHAKWHLAPIEMAWQGRTLGQICEQIKDPKRNGGLDHKALHHHMAEDSLVGWAWNPGGTREPAPGTQRQFGELIQAWLDSGAECPAG